MEAYIRLMHFTSFALVIAFILPISMAGITNFWDMTPVDDETLTCLKENGYLDEAFALTVFDSQSQKWKMAVEMQKIAKVAEKTHLIVSTALIEGTLSPQLEALRISRQIPSANYAKIWISLSNFITSFKPSCQYLRIFVLYLRIFTHREVGIQSEQLFWQDLFQDNLGCPELSQYSLYLSFNQFKPFGGWKSYEYFETYRPVPVCGFPGMEVFKN